MSVRFDEIQVGDRLPEWSRQTSFPEWNRYAAVNHEFVPFHMDDAAGRAAGNPTGAFGMGNLRYAYIVNALHDWIGDEGVVREAGCQHRVLNCKGRCVDGGGRSHGKARRGRRTACPSRPQRRQPGWRPDLSGSRGGGVAVAGVLQSSTANFAANNSATAIRAGEQSRKRPASSLTTT